MIGPVSPMLCEIHRGDRRRTGFTLIELMITVAVVAILAAIALPNYTEYVRRSERANARASLMQLAQCLERTLTLNSQYVVATCAVGFDTAKYTMSIVPGVAPIRTYVLRATPTPPWSDPTCDVLSLDNLGMKSSSVGTVASCWDR